MSASTTPTEHAHFLIVEPEPHTMRALRSTVDSLGARGSVAPTLRDARNAIDTERFTAVVVEMLLPDGSGLDLLRGLRDRHIHIPALVISSSMDPNVANRAHLLRASCAFKPDIVPNVCAFVERAIAASAEINQRTLAAAREVSAQCGLTVREHEILELVALGVPRERLATELQISENTLKTLIRRMLQKCNETSVEALARAVLDEVVSLSCTGEPL